MLKKILLALIAIIAIFLVVASLQPSEFQVTRSAVINAAPEEIFPHVNNLQQWKDWSPWEKLDPNATHSFEGPAEGAGAVVHWAGNMQIGEGSMTIAESRPNEFIKFQLNFIKPFASTSSAEFNFKPLENQTEVTWSMYGHNNLLGKAMSLIFNCEKMVGEQFDKGLADLKMVAEK